MTLSPAGIAGTDEDDPLAPEPAKLTGALIGYARVSTSGQILDRQTRALTEAGCIRVFADKLSGKTADRPELAACLDYLRAGDTLVVPSLDRLSRSLQDLITIVAGLRRRGVGFRSLHEALDTTTPGGRLVFHVFAALAEFIRELIVEGTREGLDAARARGQRLGRPPAMTGEQIRQARDLLTLPSNSISSIARLLGVSRSTIYKHLPELANGHNPAAGQIPPPRPGLRARLAITATQVAEDPAITRHRETTRCDAGQVTGSDSRHLGGLTEAQRDQAMARWQVLRPHIEDGLSEKCAVFSDRSMSAALRRLASAGHAVPRGRHARQQPGHPVSGGRHRPRHQPVCNSRPPWTAAASSYEHRAGRQGVVVAIIGRRGRRPPGSGAWDHQCLL